MKTILILAAVLAFSFSAFSQTTTADITGGRFNIKGYPNGEEPNNATILSESFSATSFLGGQYSPWFDICLTDPKCGFGKTFTVPKYPTVALGGCAGDCSQFIGGTFTINGTTYTGVYFRGSFTFSQETFFIPRMSKRKGNMYFKKPFTLTGQLQVCEVNDFNANCPADKILFSGMVKGKGTLTATMKINSNSFRYPYLLQQSFEYQFE